MNQNIQNWIIEQANNITNWAGTEVPLFIQEYLIWNFYNNLINIGFCSFILLILFTIFLILKKSFIECVKQKDGEIAFVFFLLFWFAPVLACFGYSVGYIKECVQIKVAPKVYLVEKAAELIKK